jgi:hypothetical protein
MAQMARRPHRGLLISSYPSPNQCTTRDLPAKPDHVRAGDDDSDAAFGLLGKHWTLLAEEATNLAYQTKVRLGTVVGRFGSSIGAEYVRTSMTGQS